MSIQIPNLSISGYRSFGKRPQYFENFTKINIFIGQNNAGKSNVLRFINRIYPLVAKRGTIEFDPLDKHLPDAPPTLVGIGEELGEVFKGVRKLPEGHRLVRGYHGQAQALAARVLAQLFFEKAQLDKTSLCWTQLALPDRKDRQESWAQAIKSIGDQDLRQVWSLMTNMSGGDRPLWESQVLERVAATAQAIETQLIPAIREIGEKGSTSELFDGTGIIERVAKLQNPDALNQVDRQRFNAIRDFLRDVIDRPEANIEVPYERDTILVHMDGKVLPIESLGSGLHEVLILASAATVLENHVVCIEEPELHLNPILQKKLLRYLANNTNNQYFITTHSAALMDTPGAEVYHVRLEEGSSIVERATSNEHRSAVCEDLGYHPSDLLQANCVIWVEGPSDRIYVNWWLRALERDLVEGIHYSIMFYGGRLAAHLSGALDAKEVEDFISLRRLNRRGVMLIDSDRDKPHRPINATKLRLRDEFNAGPGHAWITDGREIENYLTPKQVAAAISATHPGATIVSSSTKYDHMLSIRSAAGKVGSASKVDVARYISDKFEPDFEILDLKKRIQALLSFILASNPKVTSSPGIS